MRTSPTSGTGRRGTAATNNGDDSRHIGSEHLRQIDLDGVVLS